MYASYAERGRAFAQAIEELGDAAATGRERGEGGRGPGLWLQRHGDADRLPVAIDDGQALEKIVDLVPPHANAKLGFVDLTLAFEIADAVAIEHDPLEIEIGGGVRVTMTRGGTGGGGQSEQSETGERGGAHGGRPGILRTSVSARCVLQTTLSGDNSRSGAPHRASAHSAKPPF